MSSTSADRTPKRVAVSTVEARLDGLGARLGVEHCGHWGDICAAVLPEVYGEPALLPENQCFALPGSENKMAAMSDRQGGTRDLLVALRSLYHPGDNRGGRTPKDAGDGIKRREERERKRKPRKAAAREGPAAQLVAFDEDGLPTAEAIIALAGVTADEAARRVAQARQQQEWAMEQTNAAKRRPPSWRLEGVEKAVEAWTRGEARARFKAMLGGLDRLPPGVSPVRVEHAAAEEAA